MYILQIKPVSQQILISRAALRIYYVCQSSFTVHPPAMWQCVQVILNFEKKGDSILLGVFHSRVVLSVCYSAPLLRHSCTGLRKR